MLRINKARRGYSSHHRKTQIKSTNTTQASLELASFAKEIADSMKTTGKCMTGFRQAMLKAGVEAAKVNDLSEGTPKATVKWFERHPDMFEEVKYIKVDENNARQINSTDLHNLPAGYIVIWIPERDFASEPGHISITNGKGEAYSDCVDNMNWGDYSSNNEKTGKGEHGTFKIFRLTDKWTVDSQTGKLVFNG